MDAAAYREFTERLAAGLAGEPDVLGLVALGSMSGDPLAADAWSDHDFFVVARPGAEERLRSEAGWLPAPERIVLRHRETAHGLKVIWDDGHLAELAVFTPDELALARVNRYRVLLDRADVTDRMVAVRAATAARLAEAGFDPRWEVGQLLGALLVGSLRAARGERASGDHLVRCVAARHLLALVHRLVPAAPGAALDDLDPFRRIEAAWPDLAGALGAALALPAPAAAAAVLGLAEGTLAGRTSWPAAAAAAVRRRIGEAQAAAGAPR
jgi:hypothetical protein